MKDIHVEELSKSEGVTERNIRRRLQKWKVIKLKSGETAMVSKIMVIPKHIKL